MTPNAIGLALQPVDRSWARFTHRRLDHQWFIRGVFRFRLRWWRWVLYHLIKDTAFRRYTLSNRPDYPPCPAELISDSDYAAVSDCSCDVVIRLERVFDSEQVSIRHFLFGRDLGRRADPSLALLL